MDPATEIRKLSRSHTTDLIKILECGDSWKRLMAIIPKTLQKDTYKCDITVNNLPKYRSEHFSLIEDASIRLKRNCTHILLEEWSTSGIVRPSLGHLLYLLAKAELFRAADYVAELLKQLPPERSKEGPLHKEIKAAEVKEVEELLDQINYPSSAIEDILKSAVNTNINYSAKQVIPKIVVSQSPDEAKTDFSAPLVIHNEPKHNSDLIQFSVSEESVSDLVKFPSDVSQNIPVISDLLESEPTNIPDLSLLDDSQEVSIEDNCEVSSESAIIPDLSLIDQSQSHSINVPNLSALHVDCATNSDSKSATSTCSSPLPNLSLNTPLPNYTYSELEIATNNFDETPLSAKGRFLGGGAFGKVYLALGLLETPVAVKKLLINSEVVNVEDTVSKQFKNEVEVLFKYKHDNLLGLLGYSCDVCTYCLLYEYMPGGALKDRLQNKENKLEWQERLYIALGTCKAVAYLHTAFSTQLIHRDIKSSNILLDSAGIPKLCDFGLIKLQSPNQNDTVTTILGTTAYMAAEALRGDVSVKMDTFSFGVVLLELLTSLPPFDQNRDGHDLVTHVLDNYEDDIKPIVDESVGDWTANDVNFAEELFQIALKCLEGKQKRPFMTEVVSILEELQQKL